MTTEERGETHPIHVTLTPKFKDFVKASAERSVIDRGENLCLCAASVLSPFHWDFSVSIGAPGSHVPHYHL